VFPLLTNMNQSAWNLHCGIVHKVYFHCSRHYKKRFNTSVDEFITLHESIEDLPKRTKTTRRKTSNPSSLSLFSISLCWLLFALTLLTMLKLILLILLLYVCFVGLIKTILEENITYLERRIDLGLDHTHEAPF